MHRITWARQRLTLFPERAVLWERRHTLIIADPHFGKAAAFRRAGIPVPPGSTRHAVGALESLLERTGARRLVILGDFFHARDGRAEATLAVLAEWRAARRDLAIMLVRGNHDLRAGDPPAEWAIECLPEFREAPFCFRHEPRRTRGFFTLAGHVHPAVRLSDQTGASLRVTCFYFGRAVALLPAFGAFTGARNIRPRRGDRVFAVGEGEVVELG
jgi:uncharacterized protein